MARPNKEGLDYFELDCHMDEKVRLIQAEFGLKGLAVIVLLFQRIYGEQGYYMAWDEDRSLLFMSDNGISSCDINLINEIVSACIRRNIFSQELYQKYHILTSSGIQKRYFNAVARRDSVTVIKEYLLVSVGKNTVNVDNNSINVCNNSINVDRNSQRREEKSKEEKRRVKKSKEDNSVASHAYYVDEKLNDTFLDYIEMRKKIKKPMSQRAITLAQKKLAELARIPFSDSMDNDLAIQILEQSIFNSWQGLFPLKNNNRQSGEIDVLGEWRNA